jgi:glycosyltransferase involved in cell wall biosynthesis
MNILVLSNMNAKDSAPLQGLFVDNQVSLLQQHLTRVDYCKIKWNRDTVIGKLLKYPVFFSQFLIDVILKKEHYDIIHVHFYFPTIILAYFYKLLKNRKVKIIVTCHGSDIYAYDPPNKLYKKLSFYVDYWLFTSPQLLTKFYRPINNFKILCAGYNDVVFKPNFSNKIYDFIQIGTLDHNKGIDRFLKLVAEFPEQQFALVGEGKLKPLVLNATAKHKNLTYFGKVEPEKLVTIINLSKFLLSLSRNESFGLTIAEAQACGVPAITTETDGSLYQISSSKRRVRQQGKTESELIDELITTIQLFIAMSPKEYEQLSIQVREDAKPYSLSTVTDELIALYQQLYSGNQNVR